jgi:hypothetical protein
MTSRILFSKSAPKLADDRRSARGRAGGLAMPTAARFAVIVAILAAMAGALYLILVRGDALLIDLAKLGRFICF